jgi:ATPase family protein associated with various cellular activities (AAA)/winged helix domain-containing protein
VQQNQAVLLREFAALRRRLGIVVEQPEEKTGLDEHRELDGEMGHPAAIDALARTFGLSRFERDVLLLCAGVEMESALAERCAELVGRPQRGFLTFALAMATLPDPYWGAFAPSAPLRRFRLIEMENGHGFTTAPLHIDERILHYLAGVNDLDQRLEGVLARKSDDVWLTHEHSRLAQEIAESGETAQRAQQVLQLWGDDARGQESIAALLAHRSERALFVLRMDDTPAGAEMEQFLSLWTREAALLPAMLLLQWENETPSAAAKRLAERLPAPLVIASRDPVRLHRALEQYEVNKAGPQQQREMWRLALGTAAQPTQAMIDKIAEQFRLSAATIVALADAVAVRGAQSADQAERRLWADCRAVARPRLESLAERIVPKAAWTDLILPELQMQMLRQLAAQSRSRMTVYENWGFAARGRRGLGLSALFCGPSGTGKTLAAEVLAAELRLDLYRIDLSAVVSKYIGETEKNLKQVFDAAETGGVLLLFDEADALFGKRSEVKDSHDRYANIEVGYLLQRMESFQGLAILTTNAKSTLDKAFQRRLRFSVDFPFPDAAHRAAIWTRVFPEQTPTAGLDPVRLASLNMAGGSIRNIAINAAFLAAEEHSAVGMAHVLQATRLEAVKIERPVEAEIRGWI